MEALRCRSVAGLALTATVLLALGACGDSVSGPAGNACAAPPYFTAVPVATGDIDVVAVVGGLGAPGHTLPTAHAGILLAREDVPIRSPGSLAVTGLRRTTYLTSPNRQGERDFTVEFQVCKEVTGWIGHLTALSPAIPAAQLNWGNCETYSTALETVEACSARPTDLTIPAGAALGTGGLSAPLGLLGLDFGLLDSRVSHFHAAPQRHPQPSFHAICPWEQFDAASQSILFSKLRDKGQPAIVPGGEPRCGTMQVDVAGTAKGVWAEPGVTGPAAGDERRYITLANYPYRPEDMLALSLGPTTLGAKVAVVPRQSVGRVNRGFEQVGPDGQIYCYRSSAPGATESWLLSLSAANSLTIERLVHPAGESPCAADPATWRFGPQAMSMTR